jgi:hypothetical protein
VYSMVCIATALECVQKLEGQYAYQSIAITSNAIDTAIAAAARAIAALTLHCATAVNTATAHTALLQRKQGLHSRTRRERCPYCNVH